ncbi:MAG: GIY-YIG nuclease family protein [Phycisphaerae bacterium]|nr:GIY-YIG nuclease family protein [Phycisphaerae bacterium]
MARVFYHVSRESSPGDDALEQNGHLEQKTMGVIAGVYQLRICLKRPMEILVGAPGRHTFPAGWYVYTGSARHGLVQRVARHLRHHKRTHWHIDYLLAAADHVEAFVLPGGKPTECELHAGLEGGRVLIPGFGASDCHCESHLAWFRKRPEIRLMPWREFIRDCRLY